jgi:glutamine synthetase type III
MMTLHNKLAYSLKIISQRSEQYVRKNCYHDHVISHVKHTSTEQSLKVIFHEKSTHEETEQEGRSDKKKSVLRAGREALHRGEAT